MIPARFGDGRRRRIGLLGGSFNPAHAGHIHVARQSMRALGLDQVWLMVSPGNPLKPRAGMAPLPARLAGVLGTRFTADTLAKLRRRFPRAAFVFLIGADNLVQLPRWKSWQRIAASTPLAVLPRPGWTRQALHGAAASVLRRQRCRPGALLAGAKRATRQAKWCFVSARDHAASATAIRAAALHP